MKDLLGKSWGREVTAQREVDYPPPFLIFSRSPHSRNTALSNWESFQTFIFQ